MPAASVVVVDQTACAMCDSHALTIGRGVQTCRCKAAAVSTTTKLQSVSSSAVCWPGIRTQHAAFPCAGLWSGHNTLLLPEQHAEPDVCRRGPERGEAGKQKSFRELSLGSGCDGPGRHLLPTHSVCFQDRHRVWRCRLSSSVKSPISSHKSVGWHSKQGSAREVGYQ